MRRWIGAGLVLVLLGGCSAGSLERTGYETLESMRRQQCLDEPGAECPPRESWEAWKQKRGEAVR